MLALTRRVGEEVIIGDPRKPLGIIRVVEIHGDKVRLSFDFPRDMQINRKELAAQKAKQELLQSPNAPIKPSKCPTCGGSITPPPAANPPGDPATSPPPTPEKPPEN